MDPDFALFHLQRALWDPVDPTLLGRLEPEMRAKVNGETYRFGSPSTLRKFRRAPALYCGLLRDPVTGERFYPSTLSPHCEFEGGPYIFVSDSSYTTFLRDPTKYWVQRAF